MDKKIMDTSAMKRSGKKWRPQYHFTAPTAWLNDPNGLIYFKGWYHLFYQHNPYGCEWGAMHWGHAVSEDMLHWKDMPVALTPDQSYDSHSEGGCFSGSAVEKDGILYLFYSATVKENGKTRQTQCIATSADGIHFTKYEGNPVIEAPPEGVSEDFRDPKVFREYGKWYMVIGGSVGGADCGGDGRVLLYESKDLYQWYYKNTVLESKGKLGTMFECPDMFQVSGKWILTCSPMNHPQYNKALYCIGTMDFKTGSYQIERIGNLDYGSDYYAPQSFLDKDGNRVLIAWQNGWPWMPWCKDFGPTAEENWRGSLSLPRQIRMTRDSQICLYPVKETGSLMKCEAVDEYVEIGEEKHYIKVTNPKCYYLKMEIDIKKTESMFIEAGLLGNGEKASVLSIDFIGAIMTLDKGNADLYGGGKINCPFPSNMEKMELDIFVDHSCIEVYVNGGLRCMTVNVYPEEKQTECWIRTPYKRAVIDRLERGIMNSVWE